MSNFTSKRNPAYVNMVDETGAQLGTAANPLVTSGGGGGGAQAVTSTQLPAALDANGNLKVAEQSPVLWSKVGELLEGQIVAGVEKDVLPNGATAIWIQSSPDNTDVIRVGTTAGFSAAWLQPGDSDWYYGSSVYLNCASAASFATQAVKYSAS